MFLPASESEPKLIKEILDANQQLLDTIAAGDWATYQTLCADDMTAFEPESLGFPVEGLPFHKYYFPDQAQSPSVVIHMIRPKVRFLSKDRSSCVVSYLRLNQSNSMSYCQETRIWTLQQGRWINVHFHKSTLPSKL
ncbi:Calcium/calmodulin-dependent protein kinase II, association-domain-containing protein [Globomyces pollinis-pini]|nr:Calcium/calmodulin-dependent protein kinase II, association-domain-containing protein [Globomyces pollinis-pini]